MESTGTTTNGRSKTTRHIPLATYRLQLHRDFDFRAATEIVPYLHALGISDAYSSPFLKARPGSTHGYDITDHRQINPEIGGEAGLDHWSSQLAAHGMGIILDIVPNHMAVVGNENSWWTDVLENGPSSPFAGCFDIAWSAATRVELHGRVLIPVLGDPYAKVLEAQQLRLEREGGAFNIRYFDHLFPVAPRSYAVILGHRIAELETRLDPANPALIEYQSILTAVKHLPLRSETEPEKIAERQREKEVIKRRLANLTLESPEVATFIDENLAVFNGTPGDPASFDLLEQLLDVQTYRLAFWRVAAEEINYRRFFDINDLAALSMERSDVFHATHDLILQLIRDSKVRGVRIDHPDGLFDPREYLVRLQDAVRPEPRDETSTFDNRALYVVVEKILAPDESLPTDWPIDGTSGYDFLNLVNGLFVDSSQADAFSRHYANWIGDETTFAELVYQKKILILQIALAGEMQMLTAQLDHLAQRHRNSRDFTRNSLRLGLREIIACFPVYRSYISGDEVREDDRRHVLRAVRRATLRNAAVSTSIFHFIRDMLLLRSPGTGPADPDYVAEQRQFVGKFQQVTSPVMAKGAEDTAAYIFNRLISLNEVGGDPDLFGGSVAAFHYAMIQRLSRHPHALSATSTHDTKRGEDVRARINVLSEVPEEWFASLARWGRLNETHRIVVDDGPVPDRNEECFLYQTLIGAWPADSVVTPEFVTRIQEYMIKALHEAKVHTSWINPNQPYDDAVTQFVARILDPELSHTFLDEFQSFQRRIRDYAIINSLAQTLLKITAPGVPDMYQGTELWDLWLVDPDNRRPVDFTLRRRLLNDLDRPGALEACLQTREDGRIKMFVTRRALATRRDHPHLFTHGEYLPIEVDGPRGDNVVSFARLNDKQAILVAVPRLLSRWTSPGETPFTENLWLGSYLVVDHLPTHWRHAFTEETFEAESIDGHRVLSLDRVFAKSPVCLLIATA